MGKIYTVEPWLYIVIVGLFHSYFSPKEEEIKNNKKREYFFPLDTEVQFTSYLIYRPHLQLLNFVFDLNKSNVLWET